MSSDSLRSAIRCGLALIERQQHVTDSIDIEQRNTHKEKPIGTRYYTAVFLLLISDFVCFLPRFLPPLPLPQAPSSSSSCLLPPFRHLLVLDADEELTLPVLELIAELLQMDEQTKRLSHSAHSSTAAAAVVDPNVDPSLFALKFSCHCFDSSGMGAPRSNSGLWNPRIFTLLPGLSFKNLVDNYRFERLYYQDLPIPTSAYLKERDLTPELLHRYTKLIVHANEAHTNGGDGPAASSSASSSSSSNGTTTTASTSSSASSNHNSFSHSLNDLNDFTLPDYLHGDDAGGHLDDSDVSIHPSILIPMRHYIPSVKERRRKNKRYKAGLATTTTTANTNVPLDLDTLSIAGGGGVTHSESTSIQPTRMTPQKSRIFPAASAQI